MMKSKEKNSVKEDANTEENSSELLEASNQLSLRNKDDEFQVLNALEIFWNINLDNIELLKQNWG